MSRGSEVLRSSVPPESVLKQGWMEKRGDGQFGAEWRTRYFSLTGSHLIYFEKPDSECALGCIYLHKARAKLSKDSGAGQTLRFELQVKSCASERMYYLACATMDDQQSWLAAIKDAVANCPAQVYSNALSCVWIYIVTFTVHSYKSICRIQAAGLVVLPQRLSPEDHLLAHFQRYFTFHGLS